MLFGLAWQGALVAGLALAMSSTAIVLQSLNERGLFNTSAGRSSFAVLLFQDVALIPMLALLPLLAALPAPTDESAVFAALPAWDQAVVVLAIVAAIVLAGRYLMQPLFRWIAGAGHPRGLRRIRTIDRRRHHAAHAGGGVVCRARHILGRRRARR